MPITLLQSDLSYFGIVEPKCLVLMDVDIVQVLDFYKKSFQIYLQAAFRLCPINFGYCVFVAADNSFKFKIDIYNFTL